MTSQDVRPLLNRKSPPNSTLAPGPAPTRLRFRLSVKFMLVAAALLLPLGVAIYSIAGYSDDDIAFGRTEQTGVAYVAPLSALLQELAKSPASKAPREFDELQRLTTSYDDALRVAPQIAALRAQPTLADVLALFAEVSSNSKLSVDPDPDAYYTMTLAMDTAPKLAAAAAQLKVSQSRMLHESVIRSVKRAIAANPELTRELSISELEQSYERFVDAVDAPRYAPEQIAAANQAARELSRSTLALGSHAASALDRLLAKRIDGFESHRNHMLALTVLLFLLTVGVLLSASWQWVESQLREPVPVVVKAKPAPEALWPMATVRARAFIPHASKLKKS
jgi:hypothetical protein